jgi:hypothetical protein
LEERGNVLRGSLGTNLRRAVCDPACNDTKSCRRREECPLARLFEPRSRAGAPFGAADAPRPFLFRPPLDPHPDFSPTRPLIFELRLFGSAIAEAVHFVLPLFELTKSGLAGRPIASMSVCSLDWLGRTQRVLVDNGRVMDAEPLALDFDWCLSVPSGGPRARVEFRTPTRLTARGAEPSAPRLSTLVRRVRDRLSFLSLVWADRPWNADYGLLGHLADRARTVSHDGLQVTHSRRSTKTGQTMEISGFRGTVTCDGIDPALWPLLHIGEEIHVGRFTEWGLGLYRIEA